jgi:hypothetical protein
MLSSLLSVFKAGGHLIQMHEKYRDARRRERFEKVLSYLGSRVENLEESVRRLENRSEDLDLFHATLASLEADDESQKTLYYAAFLARLLAADSDRSQLRLVSVAIKTLSYIELEHFAKQPQRTYNVEGLPDGIDVAYPSRIQSLALFNVGKTVQNGPRITTVGKLLQAILSSAGDCDDSS